MPSTLLRGKAVRKFDKKMVKRPSSKTGDGAIMGKKGKAGPGHHFKSPKNRKYAA
jgi:hypothetical protein